MLEDINEMSFNLCWQIIEEMTDNMEDDEREDWYESL